MTMTGIGLNQAVDFSIALDTTPVEILAVESGRKYLLIQNVSTEYIGISLTTATPSVSTSGVGGLGTIVLAPGNGITFDTGNTPANALNGVAASGSGNNLTIIQW